MAQRAIDNAKKVSWKEGMLSSFSALFVTILGGAILWYFTYEPQAQEKITYVIDSSATFLSQGTSLSFVNIRVKNEGRLRASDVVVKGNLVGLNLKDSAVTFTSGPAGEYQNSSQGSLLLVRVPLLLPDDGIVISLLLDGRTTGEFPVAVRTSGTLGRKITVEKSSSETKKIFSVGQVIITISAFMLAQIMLSAFLKYRRNKRKGSLGGIRFYSGLNNSGFILMHQGLYHEARDLFSKEISEGKGECITFSNLALALVLTGDERAGLARLNAISWLHKDAHEDAVVRFNSALISYARGLPEEGFQRNDSCVRQR